jgi:hypothetical protein
MPQIGFIPVVRSLLEAAVPVVAVKEGLTEREVRDKVRTAKARLYLYYHGLPLTPEYSDIVYRLAYLCYKVPVQADILAHILRNNLASILRRIGKNGQLAVVSLGGGPGTALLALAKVLQEVFSSAELPEAVEVEFVNVDRVGEWRHSMHALANTLRQQLEPACGKSLRISAKLIVSELTDLDKGLLNEVADCSVDLWVISYVLSCLELNDERAEKLGRWLGKHMEPGALLLFADICRKEYRELAMIIAEAAGVELKQFHFLKGSLPEQEREGLAELVEQVGFEPVLSRKADWAVGTKKPQTNG